MSDRPFVPDAPGLKWRPRASGEWEARWVCRTDLAKRGYGIRSISLWIGTEPGPLDIAFMQDRCNDLQTDMLTWGRGGLPLVSGFDGTIESLIRCYQTDEDSTFRKLRYRTRMYYSTLCGMLAKTEWSEDDSLRRAGTTQINAIKARTVLRWHETWSAGGKVAMGHAMVGMLRTLFGFGATILEDPECERMSGVLHKMRFPMAKSRNERLTADLVGLVRAEANRRGLKSMALAQAIQFELMLRQKDVIGEWVPISEPGVSVIHEGNMKWLRGIRWDEVDQNMVLTHITSKRQKEIVVDLKLAPMVIEELGSMDRAAFPASGPIIIRDKLGMPWRVEQFRMHWRAIADACGIPKNVRNMDSRAGAISEATDAGADLEHVRHAATHSDIGMTQKYSRGGTEKTAGVMRLRSASRVNKPGKSEP